MGALPAVTTAGFGTFTGVDLDTEDEERITVLLDRGRRNLNRSLDLADKTLTADDLTDLSDAIYELTWWYWEAEKAGAMEILALPVSQLSLGTLFWTKEKGGVLPPLNAVKIVLGLWPRKTAFSRVTLEGEPEHPYSRVP